jgi:hypothetical protein
MKRYTAQILILDEQLVTAQLKTAIENELLRAPLTFRWGAVTEAGSGVVWIEIASDAKHMDIVRILREVESKYPVRLESVGWGWLVTEATVKDLSKAYPIEADPHAFQKAQTDETRIYTYSARWLLEGVMTLPQAAPRAIVVNTLFIAAIILGILYHPKFLVLILVAICYVPLQFIFLNARQFLISAHHILCDQRGIEVKYRFRRFAQRRSWTEIREIDLGTDLDETCWIRSANDSLKFSIKGLKDRPTFIKTITERASLRFVEVGVYKRFDA